MSPGFSFSLFGTCFIARPNIHFRNKPPKSRFVLAINSLAFRRIDRPDYTIGWSCSLLRSNGETMRALICFTLTIVSVVSTVCSEDTKGIPDWKPNAKHMESLGEKFELGGISLRPPAELSRVSHPRAAELQKAGSQIYTWIKERESGVNLTFAVQALAKRKTTHTSVEEMDAAMAGVLKAFAKLEAYRVSKPADGKLGNSAARRLHFSAKLNEQKLTGFIVALDDGNGVILITGIAPATEKNALGVMASSAFTIKREAGRPTAK